MRGALLFLSFPTPPSPLLKFALKASEPGLQGEYSQNVVFPLGSIVCALFYKINSC